MKAHCRTLQSQKELLYRSKKSIELNKLIDDTHVEIEKISIKIAELLKYSYRDKLIIPDKFWFSSHEIENGSCVFDTNDKNQAMILLPEGLVVPEFDNNDSIPTKNEK